MKGHLISNHYNLLYAVGFKGLSPEEREGWGILVGNQTKPKKKYLITDLRYTFKKRGVTVKMLSFESPFKKVIQEIIRSEKLTELTFEKSDLTYQEYEAIKKIFDEVDCTFTPEESEIAKERTKKSPVEIEKIRKACKVTDDCFKAITKTIKPGQTEKEIAFRIEMWLKQKGHELAFYPIVAVGKNGALPHYDTRTHGSAKVTKKCTILIDFGAKVDDYCADMTRIVALGKPSNRFLDAYDALLIEQKNAIDMLKSDTSYATIDTHLRNQLEKAGYPPFMHATGHGLGLEIHEGPGVSMRSKAKVEPGHVITIEPGIYIEGAFGIRIEDTVAIGTNGKPDILTKTSKELLLLL